VVTERSIHRIHLTKTEGIELWLAEVSSGKTRNFWILLNNTNDSPFYWISDNQTLICFVIPQIGRTLQSPQQFPRVSDSGKFWEKDASLDISGLVKNPYDESLFEHYASSQIFQSI